MYKFRKFLAILLCMILCLSLLPMYAFAEEGNAEPMVEESAEAAGIAASEPVEMDPVVEESAEAAGIAASEPVETDPVVEEEEPVVPDPEKGNATEPEDIILEEEGDENVLEEDADAGKRAGADGQAEASEMPVIKAASPTFSGQILLNIKFAFSDALVDQNLRVFMDNGVSSVDLPVSEAEKSGDLYIFPYPIPIPEFAKTITIRVLDADGNAIHFESGKLGVIDSYQYGLSSYINNKRDDPDMGALVRALEVYGQAAENRFLQGSYALDLSNVSLDAVTATLTGGSKPAGVAVSQNVSFESDNSLNIKITLPQGKTVGDYTITKPADAVQKVDGQVVTLTVPNIAAPELSNRHVFSISDGSAAFTIDSSAMAYAKNIAGKADSTQEDINLMKALYQYHLAAAEYFHYTPDPDQSTFTIDDLMFESNGAGTCRVKTYVGDKASLTVPGTIPSNDSSIPAVFWGAVVTEIGPRAFEGNAKLVSIDLPDSVQLIAARAFAGCINLSSMS